MRKSITISAAWLIIALLFYALSPSMFSLLFLGSSLFLCAIFYGQVVLAKKYTHMSLHVHQEGVVGQPHICTVTVTNKGWLPIMRLRAAIVLQHAVTEQMTITHFTGSVAPRQQMTFTCEVQYDVIGKYDVSLQTCTVYDAVGLFQAELVVEATEAIVIMPNMYTDMHRLQPLNAYHAAAISQQLTQGEEVSELRPYVVGDELKYIHWKLSARLDDVYVKRLEQPIVEELLLTVDFTRFTNDSAQYEAIMTSVCTVCVRTITDGGIVKLATYNDGWHIDTLSQHAHVFDAMYRLLSADVPALTIDAQRQGQLHMYGAPIIFTANADKQFEAGYVFIANHNAQKVGDAA